MSKFAEFEKDFNVESCRERFDAGPIGKDNFGGYSKTYYDPMNRVDKRMDIAKQTYERMQKVSIDTQTGGAGTAGTALVPVYPDPNIVDRTVREMPLRAMLPRRAVRGLTYDYIPLTAKGGAFWAAENGSLSAVDDTYDRVSDPIKFLYEKGTISGPAIAAMRGFIDPSQLDLSVKTVSMFEEEENNLINGNATTNVLEPDGLIQSISTNTTDRSGGYPTLPLIRAEIATCFNANGSPTVAVTDVSTHNYIKGLLQDFQRNVENPSMAMMGFGIPGAFEFDTLMFVRDRFMPTGASSKRILFLDMRYIFFAVLQDLTYEEKPSEFDGNTYILKQYYTPVITFEGACSQMYGIA